MVADNVTYQFLICRTTTRPRIRYPGRENFSAPFGASAYFILSDGKEAASSVKLSFSDADDKQHPLDDSPAANNVPETAPPSAWEAPDSDEKLLSVLREEFRIRFASGAWSGKVGAAQVLSARQMSSLEVAHPANGADYCVWLPAGSVAQQLLSSDAAVVYSISAHDPDAQSPTSVVFSMLTPSGSHLGTLQCSFPRASSAGSVDIGRWLSLVGNNLTLEIRP